MIGANNGHTKTIKALLAKGAKVNAKDKRGWTALMGATQADHTEIVELLKESWGEGVGQGTPTLTQINSKQAKIEGISAYPTSIALTP